MPISESDRQHLRRAVDLAELALEAGDEPFGSVLVDGADRVLQEARNEAVNRNSTHHPELILAQWAGDHLDAAGRAAATGYTSGEHCAMCSAAHAWVGLGRIVFASSGEQTATWVAELRGTPSPLAPLSVTDVAPGVAVDGPDDELSPRVRELHRRAHHRSS